MCSIFHFLNEKECISRKGEMLIKITFFLPLFSTFIWHYLFEKRSRDIITQKNQIAKHITLLSWICFKQLSHAFLWISFMIDFREFKLNLTKLFVHKTNAIWMVIIYCFVSEYFETACKYRESFTVYPFAYRTHAHKHGTFKYIVNMLFYL